jgi:hypothetical protein
MILIISRRGAEALRMNSQAVVGRHRIARRIATIKRSPGGLARKLRRIVLLPNPPGTQSSRLIA